MASSLTYGEAITRLCQLRDEMKKTPEGRQLLREVKRENEDLRLAYHRMYERERRRRAGREKR